MPDASGNFKGQGWSRARETSWERVFGEIERVKYETVAADQGLPCRTCGRYRVEHDRLQLCPLAAVRRVAASLEEVTAWAGVTNSATNPRRTRSLLNA